jgi:ribonucleoside-diphosphate reductase alpha chain
MNEVLDQGLPLHPLQIQRDTVRDYRQIGIGVMGIADMLIKMGIRYDSDRAIQLCDAIGFTLADESIKASALLAKEYGAYPRYKKEILESNFLRQNVTKATYELVEKYGLRNSQLLTIAPTGSLSTMLGISGGIEPIFSLSYTRKTESLHGEDVYYKVFTPIAKEYMEKRGLTDEEELPDFFVTAQNINPFKRVEMQGIWQQHIDASISSTINLPESATVEDVEELYISAWKHELKGLTIFRDNCARVGVLTLDNKKEEETVEEQPKGLARGEWEERPKEIIGIDRKVYTGCGKVKLHIKIVPSEKRIFDFYITNSTKGGCRHNIEANVICMSGMLRLGGKLDNVEQAFSGCGVCSSFTSARKSGKKVSKGSSCPTAILNILKEVEEDLKNDRLEELKLIGYYDFHREHKNYSPLTIKEEVIESIKELEEQERTGLTKDEREFVNEYGQIAFVKKYNKCPECGEKVVNTGGCMICPECGYTKCD